MYWTDSANTCKYMQIHANTCKYMQIHANTCRHSYWHFCTRQVIFGSQLNAYVEMRNGWDGSNHEAQAASFPAIGDKSSWTLQTSNTKMAEAKVLPTTADQQGFFSGECWGSGHLAFCADSKGRLHSEATVKMKSPIVTIVSLLSCNGLISPSCKWRLFQFVGTCPWNKLAA